jgi:hypothetical protein
VSVPTDEIALNQIEHALNTSLTLNDEGQPVRIGGEYGLSKLLEFWSGYDENKLIDLGDNWVEYPDTVLSREDLIRALIQEIRLLRVPLSHDDNTPA